MGFPEIFLLWMQDILFAALAGEQKDLPCLRLELQRVQRAAEARVVEADERVVEHDRRPRRERQTAHGQPQREIERVLRPGAQIPAGAERRFGGLARHDIHLAIQQHPVIFPAGQRGEELARLLGERRGEAPLHLDGETPILADGDGTFRIEGTPYELSPVYHLMSPKVCLAENYRPGITVRID